MFANTNDAVVFLSTDSRIGNIKAKKVPELINKRSVYALSYHNGFKHFDYTLIDSCTTQNNTNWWKLTFENPFGVRYELIISEYQRVYSAFRGYLNVQKLQPTDVFIDSTNAFCKLTSKTPLRKNIEGMALSISYNHSFFYNNILIKDGLK